MEKREITVEAIVNATVEHCWKCWTTPADIILWNNPSAGWHTTRVEIDLRDGGGLFMRMEVKDGSAGFDFRGKYDKVRLHKHIEYTTSEGRMVVNTFTPVDNGTRITETFEPEEGTPPAVQRGFCQTILDNFRKYVETGGG